MIVSMEELESSPGMKRLTVLLFGRNRIGKSTVALDICRSGDIVCLMSSDSGIRAVLTEKSVYAKKLVLSISYDIEEVRTDMNFMLKKAESILKQGWPAHRLWFVLDNVTSMQQSFLVDSRRVSNSKGSAGQTMATVQRDVPQQVDYGILAAWSNEIIDAARRFPWNFVFVATEKYDQDRKMFHPALVGQSYEKLKGECDLLLRMDTHQSDTNRRVLYTSAQGMEVGCRKSVGQLASVEFADLVKIRDKYLGIGAAPSKTADPKQEKKE